MNLQSNYSRFLIKLKVFTLKQLIFSLIEDAIKTDEHLLADKMILLIDAMQEAGLIE